jgi:hypothetical protein
MEESEGMKQKRDRMKEEEGRKEWTSLTDP